MTRSLSLITLTVLAAIGIAGFGNAPRPMQEREAPAGEGVICLWAVYSFVAEVVERCPTDASPEMKAELKRSVDRLDAYVRANSEMT